ncbi:DUF4340 domain-containing protein [Gloeocapsa sp. PCC 73106]|uniref:DUF4340 domain-containing protein n=1 Tax=Gloeocapsa sp. PCC 73106 TaxID=102232 RepID=UPI0002ABF670|nr:DUF4340 domain-containing protein [Gloeocapsa sp. PCC 73106]ELR98007.1 hypothetical protein GLO73106DRAFT_00018270 [Gloeocapsa sp. PCC 73106]
MKLKKTTGVWLAIALALGGFVYWFEVVESEKSQLLEAKQRLLFHFTPEEIKTITIETSNRTIVLERQSHDPPQWVIKQPEEVPAATPSVMFLINLLVTAQSNRNFSVASTQKSDYGLDQPTAIVNIELYNQRLHQLILGQIHRDENQIYAQIDPNQEEMVTVSLLPITFYYAITRDLREWKQ